MKEILFTQILEKDQILNIFLDNNNKIRSDIM